MRGSVSALWLIPLLAGCGDAPGGRGSSGLEKGRFRFEAYCAPCHQPEGLGIEGGGPPLAKSSWVKGSESRLIRIVLHGVRGPITASGVTVDREMLGFGPILTDEEIASLLTFVRAQFGEAAQPVEPDSVRRVREQTRDRADYWTVAELLEIP